ncbi:MAG: hypothetical protein DRN17_03605 [Thermoplasmata archaeon]|nr:MAG: hypothetical protein DRN17_03605 [Thermoplasmata archaeon]
MRPLSGPGSQTSKYTTVGTFIELGKVLANIIGVRDARMMGSLWWSLVDATPVCTGYARASWFVTTGIVKSRNPNTPRPKIGKKAEGGWDCKEVYDLPEYPEVIYKYTAPGARKASVWYIVNLAPYMEILNTGTSKKKSANHAGWINNIVAQHVIKAQQGQIYGDGK